MLKILIPVDGSENALRAVQYAIRLAQNKAEIQCSLLNVQEPMETRVHAYRTQKQIQALERVDAEKILQPARDLLNAAHVQYEDVVLEDEAGRAIVRYADTIECDCIVMGIQGMGIVIGPFCIGSVSSKVLHTAAMPVTLVK